MTPCNIHHEALDQVLHLKTIDSTNSEAWRRFPEWPERNGLILADAQTGGRGRGGNTWFSPPEGGLWFSLLLAHPQWLPRLPGPLSIYTGVVVAEVLAPFLTITPQLKWPNDLLIEGRKVAGILSESRWSGSRMKAIVLGIGLNLNVPSFPGDLQKRAASLSEWMEIPPDRDVILQSILDGFFGRIDLLAQPDQLVGSWESYCPTLGREITIHQGDMKIRGAFQGLDPSGQARVRTSEGIVTIAAGDSSFA